MKFSIVIPVFNEEESIGVLIEEIYRNLENYSFEVVIVNDGSKDKTSNSIINLKKEFNSLRLISHELNYGQSASIKTGVHYAKYDWIVTLDGDGQNDPSNIKEMFYVLEEHNNDKNLVVVGNRLKRKDSFSKRISSKLANKIRRFILNDDIQDTGCGLKLFSRDSFLKLGFFNHMHRYLPALFIMNGHKVISVDVHHRYRNKGVSKYGFYNRAWVGLVDLFGVLWLKRRSKIIRSKEVDR